MLPRWLIVGLMLLAAPGVGVAADAKSDAKAPVGLVRDYGRLPLSFEANQGQTDPRVRFLSRGPGYGLFLTGDEAVLVLRKPAAISTQPSANSRQLSVVSRPLHPTTDHQPPATDAFRPPIANRQSTIDNPEPRTPALLRLRLMGANPAAEAQGLEELPGKSNYFLGNDPKRWRTNVPNYAKVAYKNVYRGVDLVYYGRQSERSGNPTPVAGQQLEYDFVVAPHTDPQTIAFEIETDQSSIVSRQLSVAQNGDLVIQTDGGEIRLHKPLVYQADNPESKIQNWRFLDGRYILRPVRLGRSNPKSKIANPKYEVSFAVAAYDKSKPLIIDPVLTYSTFLGGGDNETGYGVAVDADGNAYVTGSTGSIDFPTANPLQTSDGGDFDVFVSKVNATGTALVYSTYLGGSGFDRGTGIALDSSGNVYLTGMTASNNFPTTTGAFQTTFGGGTCGTVFCSDAFVAKVKADGSALVYSTYLGGGDSDFGQGIAVDAGGNAYVTGSTLSTNFPTATPMQTATAGNSDAFVTKVKPDGAGLVYSTYLGGADGDFGQAIAVDTAGNAYLTGYTFSANFPTASPLQAANAGSADGFVSKLNAAGSTLVYSTYLGGSGLDRIFTLALDGSGNTYITGDTASPDFPLTNGAFQPLMGAGTCGAAPCSDAFVTKLDSAGSALLYSTYLGGIDVDQGSGIAVDASGNAFVTGFTRSADFPFLNALQTGFGAGTCGPDACPDAFVTELDATGSGLVYSTYLGGDETDFGQAIAVDASANAFVTGSTASHNFPATVGVLQTVRGGDAPTGDAFVAKIGPMVAPAIALFPQKLTFSDRATGFTSPPQTVTLINSGSAPLSITSIVANGDFAQTNTCGNSVAAGGATCTIDVTFTPTETGSRTGDITITDNAGGSPHAIALTGTGITPTPAVTLEPAPLDFPDQTVGTTSAGQTVTLTNSGTAELSITSIAISGDYAQTNTCPVSPATLAVAAACTIDVTFTPTTTGSRSGDITVTDNATGSPHKVILTGIGLPVFSLSATNTSVIITRGTDSATFTVSATAPAEFTSSITLGCVNNGVATCTYNPTSITSGQTSTLTVANLKQITAAALNFQATGTSQNQTATLDLSVPFADYSLSASPNFATVAAGDATSFTLTLTPANGFNGTATFSCSGLPQETKCVFSPESVTLDGTNPGTAEVSIQTTRRSAAPPPIRPWPRLPWLLGLMVFAVLATQARMARRRVPAFAALATALILLALFLASCGQDYYYPIHGTTQGTYTIALTGTSGGASHSTLISLTVN
jgi:hypothetical protein